MNRFQYAVRSSRPRPRILLLALASFPVLAGCSDSTGPILTLWEGTLSPIPPSQVSGTTAAVTQFGRTEISIDITLAEPGIVYTWRVEESTCQSGGPIQDGPAVYPPLEAEEGGTASASIFLTSQFKSGSQLAVKVFRPEGGSGERMVSCGTLQEV